MATPAAGIAPFLLNLTKSRCFRRAVSEVTFPTLKQRAEQVAQGIIDLLSEQES